MFVDEITITARAGNGGSGVVRWNRAKFKPFGGPAGGNGGKGGDVYLRAVRDVALLSKYTGARKFQAEHGEDGQKASRHGKGGEDLYIDVPVGATVTDAERGRTYVFSTEGQVEKVLTGGSGGLGNEYFKSSTNRAPQQSTEGTRGEEGTLHIEVTLIADVGLVGLPNAGKSSLLNMLTNASSQVGAYQFTTLEPHLGELYGYIIADIPGLIEGASEGKGLGHTFLRHISRTRMLLHLVSLESERPLEHYYTIRKELSNYSKDLENKEEWIIFTKKDLVNKDVIESLLKTIDLNKKRVFVISQNDAESIADLKKALVGRLQEG